MLFPRPMAAIDPRANWRSWGRLAGQPLPHDERHGLFQRRILAVGGVLRAAAVITVVQHCREIGPHALHDIGADRLDPGLLDCFKHGARGFAFRAVFAVNVFAMVGEPERHRVGEAPRDRNFGPVQVS